MVACAEAGASAAHNRNSARRRRAFMRGSPRAVRGGGMGRTLAHDCSARTQRNLAAERCHPAPAVLILPLPIAPDRIPMEGHRMLRKLVFVALMFCALPAAALAAKSSTGFNAWGPRIGFSS